eukprot:1141539-Pelagomonas_calceolata.AAC.8
MFQIRACAALRLRTAKQRSLPAPRNYCTNSVTCFEAEYMCLTSGKRFIIHSPMPKRMVPSHELKKIPGICRKKRRMGLILLGTLATQKDQNSDFKDS